MNGGEKTVQCLICEKNVEIREVSNHTHLHMNYYPYKCNDCDEKFIERAAFDEHIFEKNHNGYESVDPYKHQDVERRIADTLFVAKNGMDKLLRKKRREMNDDEEEKTSASAFSIASNKTVVTGEIKKEENEREEEVEESIISRRSSGLLVNSKTGRIIEPPQKKSKSTKTDEMTKSSTSSTVEVATSNNPVKGDRPMSTNRLGAKDSQNNISNDVSLSIAKALLYKDPRFPQSHADRRWEWKPEELQMKARWLLPKINSTHKTHFSIIDVIIHINFLRNSARKGDRTKNPLIPFGESIEMVEIAINSSVSKEGEKKKSRDSTSTGSAKNAMEIDQSELIFSLWLLVTPCGSEVKQPTHERKENRHEIISRRRSSKTDGIVELPLKKFKSTKPDENANSSTSTTVEVAISHNPVKGALLKPTERKANRDSTSSGSAKNAMDIDQSDTPCGSEVNQPTHERKEDDQKIISRRRSRKTDGIVEPPLKKFKSTKPNENTKSSTSTTVEVAISSNPVKGALPIHNERKENRDSTSSGSAKNAMVIDQSDTPCGSEVKQPTHERKDDHQKQPLRVVKKSNEDKSAENEEDEEGEVSCICGQTEGDGKPMVQCDTCKVWRHILCVFPETKRAPKGRYECYKCILCPERAIFHEDQLKKIQELKQREK